MSFRDADKIALPSQLLRKLFMLPRIIGDTSLRQA